MPREFFFLKRHYFLYHSTSAHTFSRLLCTPTLVSPYHSVSRAFPASLDAAISQPLSIPLPPRRPSFHETDSRFGIRFAVRFIGPSPLASHFPLSDALGAFLGMREERICLSIESHVWGEGGLETSSDLIERTPWTCRKRCLIRCLREIIRRTWD